MITPPLIVCAQAMWGNFVKLGRVSIIEGHGRFHLREGHRIIQHQQMFNLFCVPGASPTCGCSFRQDTGNNVVSMKLCFNGPIGVTQSNLIAFRAWHVPRHCSTILQCLRLLGPLATEIGASNILSRINVGNNLCTACSLPCRRGAQAFDVHGLHGDTATAEQCRFLTTWQRLLESRT